MALGAITEWGFFWSPKQERKDQQYCTEYVDGHGLVQLSDVEFPCVSMELSF